MPPTGFHTVVSDRTLACGTLSRFGASDHDDPGVRCASTPSYVVKPVPGSIAPVFDEKMLHGAARRENLRNEPKQTSSPSAEVTEIEHAEDFDVLTLEALVRMKLNSFRHKDQLHLLDFISIGLVDRTWLQKLLPEHAERLQQLLDDPDG